MRNMIHMAGSIEQKGFSEWQAGQLGRDLEAYAMVYLEAGQGYFKDELHEAQNVYAGHVMLLFPGLHHHYGRRRQDPLWKEHYLVFNGPLFAELENNKLLQRSESIWDTKNDSTFKRLFISLVHDQLSGRNEINHFSSIAQIHQLLAMAQHLHHHRDNDQSKWREQACLLLSQDLNKEIILAQIAHQCDCSEQVFRKKFAKTVGSSPMQFRLQRRLDHAQALLLNDRYTLSDIAEDCGFCDPYHFSRIFKKHKGLSPGAFRAQHGLSRRARNA